MKYRTKDVRDILGISGETLRFFEKKGLISPERGLENNYRSYTSSELNKIVAYKFYRSMEFSMDEAIDMVNDSDSNASLAKMGEKRRTILNKAEYYKLLANRMEEWTEKFGVVKNRPSFTLATSPEIVFYYNQINVFFKPDKNEVTNKWLELFPFVNLTVYIPSCKQPIGSEVRIGYSLPSSNRYCFSNLSNENTIVVKPKKCLYTILEISGELLKEKHLKTIFNELNQKSYNLNGDIFGYMINEYEHKGQKKQCFELWIPIEAKVFSS